METFYDLKQKEVISIRDGCRFGFVCDLEIDICNGKILCLIIPVQGKMFCIFGKEKQYRIPWGCICKIAEDIILVDVDSACVLTDCCE